MGLSPSYVLSTYLSYHNQHDIRRALAGNVRTPNAKAPSETFMRLTAVSYGDQNGVSRAKVSQLLGISPPALSKWLKVNAPWGVGDALADLAHDQ